MVHLPLQMGIPGGPELIVVLLMFLLFFVVPVALLALAVVFGVKILGGDDDEVEELEHRVEELERELERERSAGAGATGDDEGQ